MKKWKCPECESEIFTEVNEDVTVTTVVTNVTREPKYGYLEYEYGEQDMEGGECPETRHVCAKCNYKLSEKELENLVD